MEKDINLLSIVGMLTGVIGAVLVALGVYMEVGFSFFCMSSISWYWAGYLSKNKPMMIMNFVFTVINFIGLYTWFGK